MTKFTVVVGFTFFGLFLLGCSSDVTPATEDGLEITEPSSIIAPAATEEIALRDAKAPTAVSPTLLSSSTPATLANADVLFVSATETAVGRWTFSVQVTHPDTGWEDYTDGWDVVLPEGTVAKANPDDPFTRLLLHPHETEQPFTRSQSNILIPPEVTTVTVRAHDLVDGFGGQEVLVDLTAVSGQNFEVIRQNP